MRGADLTAAGPVRLEPRPETVSHALLGVLLLLSVADVPYRSLRWMVPLTMAVFADWFTTSGQQPRP